MPIQANADGNVPFLAAGRARYNVLSSRQSTWVYHEMAAAASLNGSYAKSASQTKDEIDPVIEPGRARWVSLTEGGLFSFVGNYKRPLVCERIDNIGVATLTLVKRDFAVTDPGNPGYLILSRAMPGDVPFTIAPGEYIKATGGAAQAKIGFLLRIDEKTIL